MITLDNLELLVQVSNDRSSHPEVFLRKDVLKICSRFTEEHPCRSVISVKKIWHGLLSFKFAAYFQKTFS